MAGERQGVGLRRRKGVWRKGQEERVKGMEKILVVVDMQNDFVDGALGTKEAVEVVDRVAAKIEGFEGRIFATLDTHEQNYLDTAEGRRLPVPHCIRGQKGWELNGKVLSALQKKGYTGVEKGTFGSVKLAGLIGEIAEAEAGGICVELVGLCTDICVVSNALLLKAYFPETDIAVDSMCCAGVTPKTHEAALETMGMCQIDVR